MLIRQRIRHILLAALLVAPCVHAQDFVRKIGGYEVVVKASDNNAVLEISPSVKDTIKSFTLPTPRRFVIDLPVKDTVQNETIEVDSQGFLQRLRVGTHPDRVRIVVDLGSETLRYAQRVEGETTIFALRSVDTRTERTGEGEGQGDLSVEASAPRDVEKAPTTPAPVLPTPAPTPQEEGHRGVSLKGELPSRSPTATAVPTPTAIERSKVEDGKVKLSKIVFLQESKEVRLKLTSRSPFGLVRRGVREYVISVPSGALISDALHLDHFPPRELVGFTFVRGVESEEALHVEIGVDPNTRIVAVPDGNDIVLRVSQ